MKRRRPQTGPKPAARVQADRAAPLVLSIDASGPVESVGLAQGELVLAESARRRPRGQGSALAARIRDVLADAGRTVDDLSAIACVVGPGSFTGIRVAVATAQGLVGGLGIPTISVTATEAWALSTQGPVVVALDARRGEVYGQAFDVVGSDLRELLPLRLSAPEAWFAEASDLSGASVVGDGARLYAERLAAAWGTEPRILRHVAGPALGAVASRVALTITDDTASEPLRPIYIRDHDAAKKAP